jgi:hypothetical protein
MRIQVFIPEELAQWLANLAAFENRYPKQQAEWLLHRAIEQAAGKLSQAQPSIRGVTHAKES